MGRISKYLTKNEMEKNEKLRMILRQVKGEFREENYEIALMELEKAGKLIIASLNTYNKKL